jgi:predicted nucleic acid-binding protein
VSEHRVLDASTLMDLLLQRPLDARVEGWLAEERIHWHAPDIIGVELTSVLRRLILTEACSAHRAQAALQDYRDLGLVLHPSNELLEAALALHGSISAYDAVYVALAMGIPAPLVTADRKLAASANSLCDIIVSTPN